MGIHTFLTGLFADGRVRVAADAGCPDEEWSEADRLIEDFERSYREDLPGKPPPLSMSAARYGAATLYGACQFLVFRDVDAETIHRVLNGDVETSRCASVHYSVDLTLRFLPDAVRLARAKAADDPLVTELLQLANRWPLSSVGIEGAGAGPVEVLADDPCLLRLYVDRIIARRDLSRLGDHRVRAEATRAIGLFADLAPEVAESVRGNCGISVAEE